MALFDQSKHEREAQLKSIFDVGYSYRSDITYPLILNIVRTDILGVTQIIYQREKTSDCFLVVQNQHLLAYVNYCRKKFVFLILSLEGQLLQEYQISSLPSHLKECDLFLDSDAQNQPILWLLSSVMNNSLTLVHRFDLLSEQVDVIVQQAVTHTQQFIFDVNLQTLNVCQETSSAEYQTLMINRTTLSFCILPTHKLRLIACTESGYYWYEQTGENSDNFLILVVTDNEFEPWKSYLLCGKFCSNRVFSYNQRHLHLIKKIPTKGKIKACTIGPLYEMYFNPNDRRPREVQTAIQTLMLCRIDANCVLTWLPIELMFEVFSMLYANHNWLDTNNEYVFWLR